MISITRGSYIRFVKTSKILCGGGGGERLFNTY